MPRRLNQIHLEKGAACIHCDAPFEKPYERMPEIEGTSGNAVLRCQNCGNFSIFESVPLKGNGNV
jgi:DNA-directed RNA polymerase subunit RPC12/RpoP